MIFSVHLHYILEIEVKHWTLSHGVKTSIKIVYLDTQVWHLACIYWLERCGCPDEVSIELCSCWPTTTAHVRTVVTSK